MFYTHYPPPSGTSSRLPSSFVQIAYSLFFPKKWQQKQQEKSEKNDTKTCILVSFYGFSSVILCVIIAYIVCMYN